MAKKKSGTVLRVKDTVSRIEFAFRLGEVEAGDRILSKGKFVEVYDTRYPGRKDSGFEKFGQLVADYYVETLLTDEKELREHGLSLYGDEPDWDLSPRTMSRVLDWLKGS